MRKVKHSAFTLLELLPVMAIMVLVLALAVPAVTSMMGSNRLTSAGDKIVSLFGFARQVAITKNRSVEIRLYQFAESGNPGEVPTNPASGKYRSLQLFEIDDNGNATPLGKAVAIPASVIMDSGSFLGSLPNKLKDKTWTPLDPQREIPGAGTSYKCRAFRFLSDGSASSSGATGLSKTDKWFLTLHNLQEGDQITTPPKNYITVQIDPANGSLKIWQP